MSDKKDNTSKSIRNWAIAIIITIIIVGYGATNHLSKTPLERRLPQCSGIFDSADHPSCRAAVALHQMSGGY